MELYDDLDHNGKLDRIDWYIAKIDSEMERHRMTIASFRAPYFGRVEPRPPKDVQDAQRELDRAWVAKDRLKIQRLHLLEELSQGDRDVYPDGFRR